MTPNPREHSSPTNAVFAQRLASLIEARLLTFKYYTRWTDALIAAEGFPPRWVLDLAVTQYVPDAVRIVTGYVNERWETLPPHASQDSVDDYVAAQYLRFGRREISWATCLEECGRYSDGSSGRVECEHFYGMLNDYEDSNFAPPVEAAQGSVFLDRFGSVVASVRQTCKNMGVVVTTDLTA
jgi:hypothetical protein